MLGGKKLFVIFLIYVRSVYTCDKSIVGYLPDNIYEAERYNLQLKLFMLSTVSDLGGAGIYCNLYH